MAYQAPEKIVTLKGEDYKGMNIGGKAYAPVPRRVEAAHKNGGYSMIRCEFKDVLGIKCCEVEIVYQEQHFIGTAELRMTFSNPISDGQTSALGRALAFAGFDIETAIASAEDMEVVMQGKGAHIVEAEPIALPEPRLTLPEGHTWQTYAAALAKEHLIVEKHSYLQLLQKVTGKYNNYLTADYQAVAEYLNDLNEQNNE